MSLINRSLSAVGKIGIVIGIAVAFLFGLTSTVYLSLRSSVVKVPDVVGKDRLAAENSLGDSGLNIRVRATRPTNDAKPDTVLMQVPRAGEMVKEGQTVAVDISRVPKEGEQSISLAAAENKSGEKKPDEEKEEEKNSNAQESAQKNSNQNANQNQNQNQNKAKRNKNTNSNSNANNRNANNSNASGNNANNRNANQTAPNRNANTGNHNANGNVNRNSNNANRRAPAANTTPPPVSNPGNRRTP